MRNKFIIIGIVILLIIICILFLVLKKEKKVYSISNIKSFTFSYTAGYAVNSYVRYEVNLKDDKYVVTIKPLHASEENLKVIIADDSFMINLEKVLNKCEVSNWNGFNKTNSNVLDGDSFHLSIFMKDGESISASGYMMWPKNYGEVKVELDNLFNKI